MGAATVNFNSLCCKIYFPREASVWDFQPMGTHAGDRSALQFGCFPSMEGGPEKKNPWLCRKQNPRHSLHNRQICKLILIRSKSL